MAPQDQPQAPPPSDAPTESDVYDRQIRLWGAEAQEKMSSAKVLYIHTTGISSEILKNLVLAGVRASVADGRPYPDAMINTPSSFLSPEERSRFLSNGSSPNNENSDNGGDNNGNDGEKNGEEETEHASKKLKKMTVAQAMAPHVHELNPLLDECEICEETDVESIPVDFLKRFDIIVASQISIKEARYITKCTRENKAKFYMVQAFGFYACALIDLGPNHQFRKEVGKELGDLETVENYIPLEELVEVKLESIKDRWHKKGPPIIFTKYRCILNYYELKREWPSEENVADFTTTTKEFLTQQGLKEDYIGDDDVLKTLCATANAEVSPVCAVMGGVLGNEIIKALSGRGEPANNVLMFDGLDGGCMNFTVKK